MGAMSRPEAGLDHAIWRLRAGHDGPYLVALPDGVARGGVEPGRPEHAELAAAVVDDFIGENYGSLSNAMYMLDVRSDYDLRG